LSFKPASPPGISRYFIIGTVTMADCAVDTLLTDLRRDLAWNGLMLDLFHATSDKQRVRDRVFDLLARAEFRFDATILDKARTYERLQADPLRFYKTAWWLHFKYVAPQIANPLDELMMVASSLQIRKKKKLVHVAIRDVVNQVSPTAVFHCRVRRADPRRREPTLARGPLLQQTPRERESWERGLLRSRSQRLAPSPRSPATSPAQYRATGVSTKR
jgi:hypothetical protein